MIDPRLPFASTLPARFYTDSAVLEEENRRVFGRTWQLAGRLEQVREAGQYFTTTIAEEPVLVVWGNDGVLRAMTNVCRHRAGPVARGIPIAPREHAVAAMVRYADAWRQAVRQG